MKWNKLQKLNLTIPLLALFICVPALLFLGCPNDTLDTETPGNETPDPETDPPDPPELPEDPHDDSWIAGEIKLVDEPLTNSDDPNSGNFLTTAPENSDAPPSGPSGYEAAWCYNTDNLTTAGPKWVTGHRGQGIDLDDGNVKTMLRFVNPIAAKPLTFGSRFDSGEITLNTWIYWRGAGRQTPGDGEDKYYNSDCNQVIFHLGGGANLLRLSINDSPGNQAETGVTDANAIGAAVGKTGLMARVHPGAVTPAPAPVSVPLVPDESLRKMEWHMVTLTFDGQYAVIYLDGIKLKDVDCTTFANWIKEGTREDGVVSFDKFNVAMFRIGGAAHSPPTLNAIIDDASYWPEALSADAILSMWYATKQDE
jgi:hypothetical protein